MFVPQLNNVCKYAGIQFRIKSLPHISIERRWFAANSAVDRQKKKDGVDDKFQLIYKPPNNNLLITATSFCAFTSFTCPTFLLQYAYDRFYAENTELTEQITTLELGAMGTAAIISMIALYICRTIPLRIYNHEKEYVAILPSLIPLVTRKFCFVKGDIKDKKQSTEWGRNLLSKLIQPGFETVSFYKIKGTPILLTIKCFEKPIQFYEMFRNTAKYARIIKRIDASKH